MDLHKTMLLPLFTLILYWLKGLLLVGVVFRTSDPWNGHGPLRKNTLSDLESPIEGIPKAREAAGCVASDSEKNRFRKCRVHFFTRSM